MNIKKLLLFMQNNVFLRKMKEGMVVERVLFLNNINKYLANINARDKCSVTLIIFAIHCHDIIFPKNVHLDSSLYTF